MSRTKGAKNKGPSKPRGGRSSTWKDTTGKEPGGFCRAERRGELIDGVFYSRSLRRDIERGYHYFWSKRRGIPGV